MLVPDCDGSIGAGCLHEMADVLGRDLPVWLYHRENLIPWSQVVLRGASYPSRFSVDKVTIYRLRTPQGQRRKV